MDRKKKAGVATLISDKIDFKTKAKKRDKKTLQSTQEKTPSRKYKHYKHICIQIGAPKYIRKILEDFKKDIDSNTIILGYFNTSLSKMDRSSKQNITKDIAALKNEKPYLTDIYTTIHFKDRPHDRTQNKPQQVQEN